MLKYSALIVTILAALGTAPGRTRPDEGMWMPTAIATDLPWDAMKSRGFTLTAKEIWNEEEASLKDAMLQIGQPDNEWDRMQGYGSGAFVSSKGLILTNHHVAFDAVAALSTPEKNYIEKGFSAATEADEIPCKNLSVQLTTHIRDITAKVMDGVTDDMAADARDAKMKANTEAVVKAAEAEGLKNIETKDMYNGTKHFLFAYDMFRDVRVVYMPPRSIGEYGGETDNWMWPRHTGDFAWLRAYVAKDGSRARYSAENVPFTPKKHLALGIGGRDEGDACFIMGYPGETYRYRESYSVNFREKIYFPRQIAGLKQAIAAMEERGKDNPKVALEMASEVKSYYNALKNFEGNVEGLKRYHVVEQKAAEEKEFQVWVDADPERKAKWGDVLPKIGTLYDEYMRAMNAEAFLAPFIPAREAGAGNQGSVVGVYVLALLKDKNPRAQADATSMARRVGRKTLEEQRASIAEALKVFADAPQSQWPNGVDAFAAKIGKPDEFAAEMVKEVVSGDRLKEIAGLDRDAIAKDASPAAAFALALVDGIAKVDQRGTSQRFQDGMGPLRARLIQGLAAWKQKPFYPDANLTLRFTHGVVKGYKPRDAVDYRFYTTIAGVIEKDTGVGEFDCDEALKAAVAKGDWGRYADKKAGTIVTCFLSDTDITGGNSGSPIMNGRGQMIGIAFDGNYEAMTSDFRFMPHLTRTISVDIRYVLWVTEKVAGLKRLVDECELAE